LVWSFSKDHFHRETNAFKILRAYSEWGLRYSNFKVFTVYRMCSQLKIWVDLFFVFSLWLDRAHRVLQEKLCFKLLKHILRISEFLICFLLYLKNNSIVRFFGKNIFWKLKGWNIVFPVEFDELYPAIMKKQKTNRLKFSIVSTFDTL